MQFSFANVLKLCSSKLSIKLENFILQGSSSTAAAEEASAKAKAETSEKKQVRFFDYEYDIR